MVKRTADDLIDQADTGDAACVHDPLVVLHAHANARDCVAHVPVLCVSDREEEDSTPQSSVMYTYSVAWTRRRRTRGSHGPTTPIAANKQTSKQAQMSDGTRTRRGSPLTSRETAARMAAIKTSNGFGRIKPMTEKSIKPRIPRRELRLVWGFDV